MLRLKDGSVVKDLVLTPFMSNEEDRDSMLHTTTSVLSQAAHHSENAKSGLTICFYLLLMVGLVYSENKTAG